jgi:hypothetical protein
MRSNNCLCRPCLLMDPDEMSSRYRGPSIDASYQVSVHLAEWFHGRILKKNRTIRNKNCLWRPCLLMNRDEMSILYRGPSIDSHYQVSVHLARGLRRRILKCEKLTDDEWRPPSDGKRSHYLWEGELKTSCSVLTPAETHVNKYLPLMKHINQYIPLMKYSIYP